MKRFATLFLLVLLSAGAASAEAPTGDATVVSGDPTGGGGGG